MLTANAVRALGGSGFSLVPELLFMNTCEKDFSGSPISVVPLVIRSGTPSRLTSTNLADLAPYSSFISSNVPSPLFK